MDSTKEWQDLFSFIWIKATAEEILTVDNAAWESGVNADLGPTDFWAQALQNLSASGKIGDFDLALIRQSKGLGESGDAAVLAVSSNDVKTMIESKYYELFKTTFGEVLNRPINNLIVTVDENLGNVVPAPQTYEPVQPLPIQPSAPAAPVWEPGESHQVLHIDSNTGLNPTYTFDSFVIGSSNSFTAAAAESVVASPAKAYNPLFIYGGPGLGKTHLLHAIGNYALELYPESKVKYISSEEFTNEFINAIASQTFADFQARYREVDFLLIDDIQFLAGKEQTLEEFFHTFNTLHTAQKQVVITSDVAPKELKGFEERVRSRLEWGLMADIQPPSLETRIAILRRKAQAGNLQMPDDVAEFIASNVDSDIRALEGALIRVTAYWSLNHVPATIETAKLAIRDLMTGKGAKEITPEMIIDCTAQYFALKSEDLLSANRSRTVVGPRQIAMYLCRELTDLSLPQVGAAFGGRDHTTVMHANKKVAASMKEDTQTFKSVSDISDAVRRATRES